MEVQLGRGTLAEAVEIAESYGWDMEKVILVSAACGCCEPGLIYDLPEPAPEPTKFGPGTLPMPARPPVQPTEEERRLRDERAAELKARRGRRRK